VKCRGFGKIGLIQESDPVSLRFEGGFIIKLEKKNEKKLYGLKIIVVYISLKIPKSCNVTTANCKVRKHQISDI